MEPNKFEENIRTKFEEREIQPSSEAWSKLEAQLGTPKSSNKTLWYAIAASLVAILVVGSFLLKENKTVSNEIVEQNNPIKTINETEVATSEEDKTSQNDFEEDKIETEVKAPDNKTVLTNTQKTQVATTKNGAPNTEEKETSYKVTPKTEIAQVDKINPKTEALEALENEAFVNLKIDEVVAQVEILKTQNNTVTAQDVEALLQKAQRDIANQRLLKEATTAIDPASLLNDVENELERGFRDKVFDALGEGFNKVRTAVLERNN